MFKYVLELIFWNYQFWRCNFFLWCWILADLLQLQRGSKGSTSQSSTSTQRWWLYPSGYCLVQNNFDKYLYILSQTHYMPGRMEQDEAGLVFFPVVSCRHHLAVMFQRKHLTSFANIFPDIKAWVFYCIISLCVSFQISVASSCRTSNI